MRRKIKLSLFVKVLIAIVTGALLGLIAPEVLVRIFKTFNVLFAQLLKFIVPLLVLGLALCYGFGTAWFIQVYGRSNPISVAGALGMCVLPYLPVDAVKLALAAVLCRRLKPALKLDK